MTETTQSTGTGLVTIENLEPVAIFTDAKIDEILGQVEAIKNAYVLPDLSTKAGQEEVKSFAFRFTKTKTLIDGAGKDYVAHLKEEPKRIDALRKKVRDQLDAWAEEVRAPVTEIERLEEERVARHKANLEAVQKVAVFTQAEPYPSQETLDQRFAALEVLKGTPFDEFKPIADAALQRAEATLCEVQEAAITYRTEQEELARLRQEKAERDAAERKRLDDEEKARIAALPPEEPTKEPETVRDVLDALPPVPEGSVASPTRTAATSTPTASQTTTLDPVVEAKRKKNQDIVAALVSLGVHADAARAVVVAMAGGKIPHVTINY